MQKSRGDATSPSIPRHVAIIMDGNGRWANARGFGRIRGHRAGARRVDEVVTECTRMGIQYLTLYAFSTENWSRPSFEVNMLMRLLVQHLKMMQRKLLRNRVALYARGSIDQLPKFVQQELNRVMQVSRVPAPKLHLDLALSYGGRREIVDAARALAKKISLGELKWDEIDEEAFRQNLYHPEFPDPDLLIRTGGEYRLSNFLLWEVAYTELYVTNTLWPDFGRESLAEAVAVYGRRQRRFGKTGEQVESAAVSPTESR